MGGVEAMMQYPWPGNVRELENLIRRLAALYPQDEISEEIILGELYGGMPAANARLNDGGGQDLPLGQSVEQYLQRYFRGFGSALPPPGLYHRILAEVEYPLVLAALAATHGNQIRAAELLGVNRNTLRKKIRDLGVDIYRSAKQPSN